MNDAPPLSARFYKNAQDTRCTFLLKGGVPALTGTLLAAADDCVLIDDDGKQVLVYVSALVAVKANVPEPKRPQRTAMRNVRVG